MTFDIAFHWWLEIFRCVCV